MSEIPAFAVIIRCVHERGKAQREAMAELDRRGLYLSEDQKRQASLSSEQLDRELKRTQTYSVRYVHKVSPKDTDTHNGLVEIPGNAFSNRNTLAAALRKLGILMKGARITEMRVEGDKVVIFPQVPGLSTYWHSVILTCAEEK